MYDIPVVNRHYNDLVGHPEVRSIPRKEKVSQNIWNLSKIGFTKVHHLLEKPHLSTKPVYIVYNIDAIYDQPDMYNVLVGEDNLIFCNQYSNE